MYVYDVNEANVAIITGETLKQTFLLARLDWLMSQTGRHWQHSVHVMICGDTKSS